MRSIWSGFYLGEFLDVAGENLEVFSETNPMEPKEYTVERAEDMRTVKGHKEYYLKWKGYPSTLNSWEPLDKLSCMKLIASFEESQKNKPLKILGASNASGELMFLIQWNRSDHADFVAAKVANIQWPQMVIKFYEERLWWYDV